MGGVLASGPNPVVAGVTVCGHTLVVEVGYAPTVGIVASIAGGISQNMRRKFTGGDVAIVAGLATAGYDPLMIKLRQRPIRGGMTNITG